MLTNCARCLATAWEGDPELITGMVPGRCLENTPLLCVWIKTPKHCPGQLHYQAQAPEAHGDETQYRRSHKRGRASTDNEQGMGWTRISALMLPGFPEWVTVPFNLPSGASRSLVIHIMHSCGAGHQCHWHQASRNEMTDRSQGERTWCQVGCSLATWTCHVFFLLVMAT